jgi:hypothetical protein
MIAALKRKLGAGQKNVGPMETIETPPPFQLDLIMCRGKRPRAEMILTIVWSRIPVVIGHPIFDHHQQERPQSFLGTLQDVMDPKMSGGVQEVIAAMEGTMESLHCRGQLHMYTSTGLNSFVS